MRVVVLVNPWSGSAAGGGGDRLGEIRRAFEEAGVEAEVCEVPGEQCENAARSAAGKGWDAIVAAGGDGTINTVASALVGSDMPMGILPLGTLNHFARDLGLPQDLAGAVGVIAAGKTRRVDVGQVNGWTFVNNSSMGLYPHVVVYRDQQRERLGRGKWLAMLVAMLSVMRRFPLVRVEIAADGRQMARTTPFVFVGNNRYEFNLFRLGGRDALDAGQLCLYVARRCSRWGMVLLALRSLFGRLDQARDFDTIYVSELRVDTRRRHLRIANDGEVHRLAPPLHYVMRRGALRVLVP